MNARLLLPATLSFVFAGVLPARAADPRLVALLMPDAKVVAGVNVAQAKATPFGQYVLNQIQNGANDQKLQELKTETGFDPTNDVTELLVASAGPGNNHSGLVLAMGTFDPAMIQSAAAAKGAVTETYKGVSIIENPKKTDGIAFLSAGIVVAGDLANVKAAIDRQTLSQPISSSLAVQINNWSTSEDAWVVSAVPLSSLHPPAGTAQVPGMNGQGAFQAIQSAAGGVKFGNTVVVKAQAQADTAQNAQSMADALKLLANLAQMQAANDANLQALVQSLQIGASGTALNVQASLSEDQLQTIIQAAPKAVPNARPRRAERHM